MKRESILRVLIVLALSLLIISPRHVAAQNEPPESPRKEVILEGIGELRPLREERASWPVPGTNRRILIHASDPTGGGNVYWYMHRPMLALDDSEKRFEDLPAIVRGVELQEDGSATLTFRIQLSTPEFREFCRVLVIQQDKENIARAGGREDLVKIFRWPLQRMIIDITIGNTNRVIATGETANLGSVDDVLDFDIEFSPAAFADFRERVERGSIRFAFRYSFSNREIAVAEADFAVNSMVDSALARTLTADQRKGTALVFQDQANRLKREIRFSIASTVRTTSSNVLPRISPENIIGKLLDLAEPIDLTSWDEKDPVAAEAAKYVTPLLVKHSVQTEAVDRTTNEKENKRTDTLEVKLGGPVGSFTGDTSYKLEKEKRDLLREEHGVTITENKSGDSFAPIVVTAFRVNTNSSKIDFSVAEVQFVSVGSSTGYLVDTPVTPDFTTSQLLPKIGEIQAELYVDITPLGSMLPYFGAEPPKGWVWADGKATWPDESWVPTHLRNKPVPDLTGRVPFGFESGERLGLPEEATSATKDLPTFTLPQPVEGGSRGAATVLSVTTKPRRDNREVDGPYGIDIPHGETNSRQKGQARDGRWQVDSINLPGPWQFNPQDRQLGGGRIAYSGSELLPPRLNCRWIIRLGRSAKFPPSVSTSPTTK